MRKAHARPIDIGKYGSKQPIRRASAAFPVSRIRIVRVRRFLSLLCVVLRRIRIAAVARRRHRRLRQAPDGEHHCSRHVSPLQYVNLQSISLFV